jgi:hypothetical protein
MGYRESGFDMANEDGKCISRLSEHVASSFMTAFHGVRREAVGLWSQYE